MKLARSRAKYVKFGPGVSAARAVATATATRRLAAAYALKGETERAATERAEARRRDVGGLFLSIAEVKTVGWRAVPKTLALFEATYFAGLRKAGMPEE